MYRGYFWLLFQGNADSENLTMVPRENHHIRSNNTIKKIHNKKKYAKKVLQNKKTMKEKKLWNNVPEGAFIFYSYFIYNICPNGLEKNIYLYCVYIFILFDIHIYIQ